MSGERKVFGPRNGTSGRSEALPKKASSTIAVGRSAVDPNSGAISRSRSSASSDEKSSSSRRSSPSRRGEDTADGKKDRKRSDIDDRKTTGKGRDADGRKAKPSLPSVTTEGTVYASLPKLKETPSSEQSELMRRKMRECAVVYDFRAIDANLPEKEGKRQTLAELVDYVNTTKGCFAADETLIGEAVEMVAANIFRTLTKRERTPLDMLDPEDDEPTMDPAWVHLEIVYEFMLRFITSEDVEASAASKFINMPFVLKLLELFDSDDTRERDCLKTIMNRIYAKFSALRSNIRRSIQNVCLEAMYEKEVQNGLGELLEILGRIINSFSTPLKEESRDLLLKVLIPLHKVEWLGSFHSPLLDCTKKFVDKEPKLSYNIVVALLQFWPFSLSSKQILFLNEIEELLNVMPTAEFRKVQEQLGRRLAACLSFPNSDVAERTFSLWRSDKFVKLITQNCRDQFPVIISALYDNSTQHWHNSVHTRTFEVLKMLMETDPELFDTSSAKHRKQAEEQERKEAERERKWAMLQALHDKKKAEGGAMTSARPRRSSAGAAVTVVAPSNAKDREDVIAAPRSESNANTERRPSSIEPQKSTRTVATARLNSPSATSLSSPTVAMSSFRDGPAWPPRSGDELHLARERYGVAVTWERKDVDVDVGLQALVVDTRGRIIDAVHEHNPTALQALVHRKDERPTVDARSKCSGILWVALSRLPEQMALLVLVVCSLAGGHLGETGSRGLHIVEEINSNQIAHFPFDRAAGDAGVIAVLRRSADRAWGLQHIEEFSKTGRHFMDILEPTMGKVIRKAIPALPKRQKVMATISAMAKGAVACMPSILVAKWLFVGLSWDLSPSATIDGIGLVLSAVFLDAEGRELGAICPENVEAFGAKHSGPGVLGQGLMLDFVAAPQEAAQIFIVGHLAVRGTKFELIQRPHCCVVDPAGCEVLRFAPEAGFASEMQVESEQDFASGREQTLVAGRFFRVQGRTDSTGARGVARWAFQALGHFCAGETWRESVGELAELCRRPPGDFQSLPSDLLTPGRVLVSL